MKQSLNHWKLWKLSTLRIPNVHLSAHQYFNISSYNIFIHTAIITRQITKINKKRAQNYLITSKFIAMQIDNQISMTSRRKYRYSRLGRAVWGSIKSGQSANDARRFAPRASYRCYVARSLLKCQRQWQPNYRMTWTAYH